MLRGIAIFLSVIVLLLGIWWFRISSLPYPPEQGDYFDPVTGFRHESDLPDGLLGMMFLIGVPTLGLFGIDYLWRSARPTGSEATKPVEPTGTSSSPSDLITSHAVGESPGGSLRR